MIYKNKNKEGLKMGKKQFYRYRDLLYAWNYLSDIAIVELKLDALYEVKETPCGWWISEDPYYKRNQEEFKILPKWDWGKPRWVSKTSRRRYAFPTKEEALVSFKARKRRQITILTHQLSQAKEALRKAKEL